MEKLPSYNKDLIGDAPITESVELNKVTHDMMHLVGQVYTNRPEYKTIMMNLKSLSKEFNAIRITEVGGIDDNGD